MSTQQGNTGTSQRPIPERTGLPENTFGTPSAEVVLIHQPGKVGSSSLYQSMLYSAPVPSYQTHALHLNEKYFSKELVYADQPDESLPVHVRKAQKFYRYFYKPGKPVAVITMVRDPIARNISAFFQNIDDFPRLADPENPPPVEEYLAVFLDEWDHDFADRWFDWHFKQPFDLDWYAQGFDPEVGYAQVADEKNTYLLMQAELPDGTKERVVREFLNFDGFRLDIRANVGDKKKYSSVYKQFKALKLPQEYLDKMCGSRIMQSFYRQDQLEAFRSKWE